MNTPLLEQLSLPEDLKTLSLSELEKIAQEIRDVLLNVGDVCGGHLASNLGVVELTIALHATFNSPKDKFIFDTTHQCYVHKILTGRLDRIYSTRKKGGLSGFAKISESEHDIFGAGHASTALSAALGVAHARNVRKEEYAVAAIIGDASLSGGMAYEALNNVSNLSGNFICILNDNNMSISNPVGNMATYISKIRTSKAYTTARETFKTLCKNIPMVGEPLHRKIVKVVDTMREVVFDSHVGVMFEEFGFRYIGPIDGHDIAMVMASLRYAKQYNGPIMLHVITTKGKGYKPAEDDPIKYHGVSPKSPALLNAVNIIKKDEIKALSYTETFGKTMIEIAKEKDDVVVITPAMKAGSGLVEYAEQFSDRFFDVGIAEEHAVTFAAGLARAGVTPVLAIYSTFLQRGYDQVLHDICIQKLPIVMALDRAGLVGQDGATHHGVFDYAFLLHIPHMTILAPKDCNELSAMLWWSVKQKRAISIRYPKTAPSQDYPNDTLTIKSEKSEIMQAFDQFSTNKKMLIIGVGSMAIPSFYAAQEVKDLNIAVINLRFIKPLDTHTLTPLINEAETVIVVEEGCKIGGVSTFIQTEIRHNKTQENWINIGIPDQFVDHGTVSELLIDYNLTTAGIIKEIQVNIKESKLIN